MNLTNYHSHCSFCDGRAPLEEFICEAIRQGFSAYGISSHAPLPFSTRWSMESTQMYAYLRECQQLKQKYAGQIELYMGLEIDYLNEETHPATDYFRSLPLDYRIGSVHLLYNPQGERVDVDVTADKFRILIDLHFQGDVEALVRQYYQSMTRMLERGGFDIIGHADKIHYNISCYDPAIPGQPWYRELVCSFFHTAAVKGYIAEINTKAFETFGIFYPSVQDFPLLHSLHIPVVVNSDAHYPDRINSGRREALTSLYQSGFREVMEIRQGEWTSVAIDLS
ncbi:MAG: histidinol-phosphatase [Bacteroides sp.]|nr:histidinol-phosphatase [Bacteroides sp.]